MDVTVPDRGLEFHSGLILYGNFLCLISLGGDILYDIRVAVSKYMYYLDLRKIMVGTSSTMAESRQSGEAKPGTEGDPEV